MEEMNSVILNLSGFVVVAIIFLLVLFITFKILFRKFDVEDKIKLYGIFFNMKNKTIWSFSLISLNYLFLVWCLINFDMNYIYLFISLTLITLACILAKDFKTGILSVVNTALECFIIYFMKFFRDYVFGNGRDLLMFTIFVFVMIFIFMYFTYTMFTDLNFIVKREKDLGKKKL